MIYASEMMDMLLIYLRNKSVANAIYINKMILLLLGVLLYALPAYSQQINVAGINAQTMLQNIVTQIPNLMRLVTALSYVMGMYFMFFGILKLKQYGEQRTMMSGEHQLKGPVIYLAVGALLLYLPSSVQIGMSTFWTNPNPYGYIEEQNQWTSLFSNVAMVMQLFGIIAFIRGLLILTQLGGQGGTQPGTLGRGLTHIVGGIFCINIYQFVQVIMATLGISTS